MVKWLRLCRMLEAGESAEELESILRYCLFTEGNRVEMN